MKEREEKWDLLDVISLFHTLHFAYQKATKEVLGASSTLFVRPVLEIFRTIEGERGTEIISCKTLDHAFEKFSRMLEGTGVVEEAKFVKLSPIRYVLRIRKCQFAGPAHRRLAPKDATCPYALIAMSIFERYTHGKFPKKVVRRNDSEFTETGSKTIIELIPIVSIATRPR